MTSERKKSIIILIATLIFGVLLGLLVPGFTHKLYERGTRETHGRQYDAEHKKKWFVGTINRIIQPDSLQAKQIKPITEWAAVQIDSLESSANQHMSKVLDSVKSQLKPILTDAQQKRLDEFDAKAKSNWNKGGGRKRK